MSTLPAVDLDWLIYWYSKPVMRTDASQSTVMLIDASQSGSRLAANDKIYLFMKYDIMVLALYPDTLTSEAKRNHCYEKREEKLKQY